MNKLNIKVVYFSAVIIVILGLFFILSKKSNNPLIINKAVDASSSTANVIKQPATSQPVASIKKPRLALPIKNALGRVTKKPFGIKVSPGNSPVSPEKFSGYHTGVDFETTPDEQNIAVPIYAICDGKLLLKKSATGYGGVLVESCKIDNRAVTIIYGHLKLTSIINKVNDTLKAGQQIAILGKGYSVETAGERKHLHLGIHLGAAINLLGYVQTPQALKNWLDVINYL